MEHTTVTMTMVEYSSMLKERDDLLKNLKDARSGELHNGQLFDRKQAQLLATLELVQILARGWASQRCTTTSVSVRERKVWPFAINSSRSSA